MSDNILFNVVSEGKGVVNIETYVEPTSGCLCISIDGMDLACISNVSGRLCLFKAEEEEVDALKNKGFILKDGYLHTEELG